MNVTILNHSDSKGGASVVTVRLLQALNTLGVHTRLLVVDESTHNMRIEKLKPQWLIKVNFLAEHAQLFLANGCSKKNIFKLSTGAWGMPVHDHPWVKDADIVVLGWVNQGMLSLDEISKIKAPVVWIMHDMWNLTGICHHAADCERFREECGNCPQLHHPRPKDLSRRVWENKHELYQEKEIYFVAVSTWLKHKGEASGLLYNQHICVIPNPFPVEQFGLTPKHERQRYRLPADKKLIVMGAARLDDPIKGLDLAIDALNQLNPHEVCAVLFGDIRDRSLLERLRIPHVWLASVSKPEIISDIYAHGDVVMSSSHYETLPTTLIEGMASGCVPVCFDQGGQADIVDHLRTGYIAHHPDASDLAAGLKWALAKPVEPELLRKEIEEKFDSLTVAKRYIELFEKLTI